MVGVAVALQPGQEMPAVQGRSLRVLAERQEDGWLQPHPLILPAFSLQAHPCHMTSATTTCQPHQLILPAFRAQAHPCHKTSAATPLPATLILPASRVQAHPAHMISQHHLPATLIDTASLQSAGPPCHMTSPCSECHTICTRPVPCGLQVCCCLKRSDGSAQ